MSLNKASDQIHNRETKGFPQWKILSDGKKELHVHMNNAESKQFKIWNKHTDSDINLESQASMTRPLTLKSIPIKM